MVWVVSCAPRSLRRHSGLVLCHLHCHRTCSPASRLKCRSQAFDQLSLRSRNNEPILDKVEKNRFSCPYMSSLAKDPLEYLPNHRSFYGKACKIVLVSTMSMEFTVHIFGFFSFAQRLTPALCTKILGPIFLLQRLVKEILKRSRKHSRKYSWKYP